MGEKVKSILKATGGDKITEWESYFGMGVSGAFLSILSGLLILVFPGLMAYIVAIYLIIRGLLEIFRYSKKKSFEVVSKYRKK